MKNVISLANFTFKLIVILFTTLIFSSHSLANLNLEDRIDNVEGYPYNLLIQRTDQIKVIYQGDKQITCRVEIHKGGLQWSGDTQVVKATKFKQSPLKYCLGRAHAKQILASTF